jgi:hypothetical protein
VRAPMGPLTPKDAYIYIYIVGCVRRNRRAT